MTLRDRYRDLIDQGTSSLPGEDDAFARLTAARKSRRRTPRFAIAALALGGSVALAILALRTPKPRPTETVAASGWRASLSLYVASSDRPGEALEIVITAEKENRQ
jgi:hypothetical protein